MKNLKKNITNELLTYWRMINFIAFGYAAILLAQTAFVAAFPLPQLAISVASLIVGIQAVKVGRKAFSK